MDSIDEDLHDMDQFLKPRRIRGKQKVIDLRFENPKNDSFSWICPHCEILYEASTSAEIDNKRYNHMRMRHPAADTKVLNPRKDPVILSTKIPESQMAWKCPICKAGHGALSDQDHKRAVKHHCEKEHPDETPSTLSHKLAKGIPKNDKTAIVKAVTERIEKKRKALWADHDIVLLPRPKNDTDRGRISYCKVCLSRLGRVPVQNKGSCKDQLEKLKTNAATRMRKRTWLNNLKANDPDHLRAFLENSDWTEESLTNFLALQYKSEADKNWMENV